MASPVVGRRVNWCAPSPTLAVDPTHPLTAGLSCAFAGGSVLKGSIAARSTAWSLTATPFGVGIAGGSWVAIRHGISTSDNRTVTMLVAFYKRSGTAQKGCFMNTQKSSVASEQRGYAVGLGNTSMDNNGGNLIYLNVNVAFYAPGQALADGHHVLIVEAKGGATTPYYLDNTTVTGTQAWGSTTNGGDMFSIVGATDTFPHRPLGNNTVITAAYSWLHRSFNQAEQAALMADPFAILRQ